MEKILFSNGIFDQQTLQVKDRVCFIIGDNNSGKTQILNTLATGFKGKSKQFKVDNQYVNSGDYQVVFLKEFFDIQNEIKITRTSEFRNEILKVLNKFTIDDNRYEILLKKLQKISNEVEEVISDNLTNKLFAITNQEIKLKTKLELNSLENVVDKLLKINICDTKNNNEIIDDSNYSRFILRMLILNILASYVEQDDLRPIIFLIDLPELYGTPKMLCKINNFLKNLLAKNNNYLFITTNSPWYLNNFHPDVEAINKIQNQIILKINNSEKILKDAVILNSFIESENYDFVWYKSSISQVIEKEDLLKEWNYFNQNIFYYFSEALFCHEIYFDNSANFKIDDKKYTLVINAISKIQILLIYFMNFFKIDYQINPKLSYYEKISKLIDN